MNVCVLLNHPEKWDKMRLSYCGTKPPHDFLLDSNHS